MNKIQKIVTWLMFSIQLVLCSATLLKSDPEMGIVNVYISVISHIISFVILIFFLISTIKMVKNRVLKTHILYVATLLISIALPFVAFSSYY